MTNDISVLIVEDEDIWIQPLRVILKDFGYTVAGVARTFEEAIEVMAAGTFDLALLDIHLGGRDSGIELGKLIGKVHHKPFIFITAGSDHLIREAAGAKPSAYLVKPINASSLFIAIQSAIENFGHSQPGFVETAGSESESSFFVKHGSRYRRINWKDVVYISAGKNYISLFNAADKKEYYLRGSLQKKSIRFAIPAPPSTASFIPVNRSEVVQFSFIEEVTNDEVKTPFKNFVLSESHYKELKARVKILA